MKNDIILLPSNVRIADYLRNATAQPEPKVRKGSSWEDKSLTEKMKELEKTKLARQANCRHTNYSRDRLDYCNIDDSNPVVCQCRDCGYSWYTSE